MKIKLLLMSCVLGLVAGCKIAIIVPSGGDVVSSNAAHNCSEGNICEFEINSGQLPFSETLTAIPKAGYVFEKWSDGLDFLCGKSINPTCTMYIPDSAVGFAAVSLFDSGYAMPIFKDVGIDTDGDGVRNALDEDDDNDGIFDIDDTCPLDPSPSCSEGIPLTDTVTINGTEWAQVDLFTNLSWNDMNAICSGGPCSGVLNGYNMDGWTWASIYDVGDLFSSLSPHPGGIEQYEDPDGSNPWATDFLALFAPTNANPGTFQEVTGLSSTTFESEGIDYVAAARVFDAVENNSALTNIANETDEKSDIFGAWFYRTP